jgi:signal transduction histidine kinase
MNAVAQLSTVSDTIAEPMLLSAVLDAVPQGLALSEDGKILFANRAFSQQLDWRDPAFPSNPDVADAVVRLRSRDGSALQVRVTKLPIPGRAAMLLSTLKEPVALKVAAGQDAAQLESLGRMVSGVAHDFNNLLTGILLYCDLIKHALAHDERLTRYVGEMQSAGEQAAALIHQLMEVARRQATNPVPLSWNEAIGNLESLLRRLVGENIDLVCNLEPALGRVRMRPAQMPQVILNLALNARDAMPVGGKLILSTSNRDAEVEFEVCDTGCGMDEATRARLSEPSFTTKQPGKGHGLGLATVRRIAEEQNGSFHLESTLGRGTRVRLRLPRIAEDQFVQKGSSL